MKEDKKENVVLAEKAEATKIKEYDDVYFKILSIINSCDTSDQLKFCGDNLVEIFKKKKFKKDVPTKKEMEDMVNDLIKTLHNKKDTLRRRKCDERKKEKLK